MPRVLIISYHFPPAGGPAVQRVMGMVRHLPAFGWDPVVLTVRDGTYMNRDNAALADVPPGVPVYRAATIEPYAVVPFLQHLNQTGCIRMELHGREKM